MLAEVKGGVASYGSRIMLGLLVECSPELCAESVERVRHGCRASRLPTGLGSSFQEPYNLAREVLFETFQQQTRNSKSTASVFGLIQEVTTSFRRGLERLMNRSPTH